jgi:hypothetical protein
VVETDELVVELFELEQAVKASGTINTRATAEKRRLNRIMPGPPYAMHPP